MPLARSSTDARPPTAALRLLVPVKPNGWSLTAGYLGLLAPLPLVHLLALLGAGIAAGELRQRPDQLGWGRVAFAFATGGFFTLLYTFLLYQLL